MGARFSAPVQTGSEVHPASYTMCTVSFPGVRRPERGVDHPPHLEPRLKKENYTSTPPLALRGLFYGELYLYMFTFNTFRSKDRQKQRRKKEKEKRKVLFCTL
jgi:hypothetical protein